MTDGTIVGAKVGLVEGSALGITDGFKLGLQVGFTLGNADGGMLREGLVEGSELGVIDGLRLGNEVGTLDIEEGADVGIRHGINSNTRTLSSLPSQVIS